MTLARRADGSPKAKPRRRITAPANNGAQAKKRIEKAAVPALPRGIRRARRAGKGGCAVPATTQHGGHATLCPLYSAASGEIESAKIAKPLHRGDRGRGFAME